MRLTYAAPYASIVEPVTDQELPDFLVVSGPNGSGKSNLLSAIHTNCLPVEGLTEGDPGQQNPSVKLFSLAQLILTSSGAQSAANFRDRHIQLQQATAQAISNFTNVPPRQQITDPIQLERAVQDMVVGSRQLTREALDRMTTDAGKPLIEFTLDDFRRCAPAMIGVRDPFSLTLTEVFLTYHSRSVSNDFLQWRQTTKDQTDETPLTDNEFSDRYGPAPWDLLNETLRAMNLAYRVAAPQGVEPDAMYEPRFVDDETGTSVTAEQLSSGEKTLMAIAMSLYTGSGRLEVVEMPTVLLLDEADASLHPSMVKTLLQVLREIFVGRYGVKVIMTTHSPTTVALAPESSLYTMSRRGPDRLRSASVDDALKSLTVGLPMLSVSTDLRRQVVVESRTDEACYQLLFQLTRQQLSSPVSLEFIAAGHERGGGTDNVKRLVSSFREAGNSTVWGIVDRDERHGAPVGVKFLESRYSIENLVLDPLLIGLFLLRERHVAPTELRLPPGCVYYSLGPEEAQAIIDALTERISTPQDDMTPTVVTYQGGITLNAPTFWLNDNGHALETRLLEAFPCFRSYRGKLKQHVIKNVLVDVPWAVPDEVLTLFEQLQSDVSSPVTHGSQ